MEMPNLLFSRACPSARSLLGAMLVLQQLDHKIQMADPLCKGGCSTDSEQGVVICRHGSARRYNGFANLAETYYFPVALRAN